MVDYLDDIASDFSAIHGIRDITTLSGPAFFRLAFRLSAYQGVMAARRATAMQAEQAAEPRPAMASAQASPMYSGEQPRRVTPSTKAALQASPAFKGIFSFAKG
jgi:hypothetical protein